MIHSMPHPYLDTTKTKVTASTRHFIIVSRTYVHYLVVSVNRSDDTSQEAYRNICYCGTSLLFRSGTMVRLKRVTVLEVTTRRHATIELRHVVLYMPLERVGSGASAYCRCLHTWYCMVAPRQNKQKKRQLYSIRQLTQDSKTFFVLSNHPMLS